MFVAFAGLFQDIFYVENWKIALGAAVLFSILETLVKPILSLLFLPINILTFGIFNLFINAIMLELTSYLMGSSFQFSSFGTIFVVSLLMSLFNYVITTSLWHN
ncbi:hypothetical protein IV52_GL000700 [Fructilactobacillus lindneri DSM 20690 = JCM 11027]|uniref:Phage holin family protein n=1 Tax=Fructilactobacillus lindneri DSM 20690 = JCM 11027 TaxID=1122148 RepID=A0A0R2JQ96_9LACO|nr:hypothetical protein IV52_GL000700 [Fructilactobacillus lindneri DSM 20690 = JCM 11027]